MKHLAFTLVFVLLRAACVAQQPNPYRQDFEFFWSTINEEYCYFDKTKTNWQKVKAIYAPVADTITGRSQFVSLLEKVFNEIYDHHAILNTNTNASQRLVPSGTDTWAAYVNGKPLITELRPGFGTAAAGIVPGMEVVAVNDMPVAEALIPFLPKAVQPLTTEARNYALRLLLAGNHTQPRKFTLRYQGVVKDYYPDQQGLLLERISYPAKVETKLIGNTGYIKINDCLYDNGLIPVFDSIMSMYANTSSLILDLRETPSGGNTSVARAILGWFINKEQFYQKHEYYAEEKSSGIKRSWIEIVAPRPGKYYSKPLVILCNHWTGSIAEGITIGFDALKRPRTSIIGTDMGRLKGAIYSFEMPNSKIRFSFPAERLYHINGTPRENFVPGVFIDLPGINPKPGEDVFIQKAVKQLEGLIMR